MPKPDRAPDLVFEPTATDQEIADAIQAHVKKIDAKNAKPATKLNPKADDAEDEPDEK
jgi:hypothetical protein